MELHEFESYLELPEPDDPEVLVSIDDVGSEERTLCLGYDVMHDTVHVYVAGGVIHLVRYNVRHEVLEHRVGYRLPAVYLRPGKRAYPHATDLRFAEHMLKIGFSITFTGFTPEEGG